MTERKPEELDAALEGLAYQFVMLGEAMRRIELAQGRPFSVQARQDGSFAFWAESVATTSGESWPTINTYPSRTSLTEFRAYVEWTLLLARKLSDVVSSKGSRPDDVLAYELLGQPPPYGLSPLSRKLRTRIDKLVAHQTYFEDVERKEWPMGEIARWRDETLAQFRTDLRAAAPERADTFEASLDRFDDEVQKDRRSIAAEKG